MADTAAPAAPIEAKQENIKPEKPDEDAHKAALKQAEKSHADVMVKLVSYPPLQPSLSPTCNYTISELTPSLFRMLPRLNWTLLSPISPRIVLPISVDRTSSTR